MHCPSSIQSFGGGVFLVRLGKIWAPITDPSIVFTVGRPGVNYEVQTRLIARAKARLCPWCTPTTEIPCILYLSVPGNHTVPGAPWPLDARMDLYMVKHTV